MCVSCVAVKTSGGVCDVTEAVTEREWEVVGVRDDTEGDVVRVGVCDDVAAAAPVQMDDTVNNITIADLLAAAAILLLLIAISTQLMIWILSSHTEYLSIKLLRTKVEKYS